MSDDSLNPFEASEDSSRRTLHVGIVMVLALLVLWGSLFWHQVVKHEEYIEKESSLTFRRILKEGARGSIYDRNGVLLAGNQPRFSVGINVDELREDFQREYRELRKDEDFMEFLIQTDGSLTWEARLRVMNRVVNEVSELLQRPLTLNEASFRRQFGVRLLPFIIAKDLTNREYARLTEQLSPESPIQILAEPYRYYPYGSAASHVLGYVSDGDMEDIDVDFGGYEDVRTLSYQRKIGKSGIERSLDAQLRGGIGWEIWRVDPVGVQYELFDEKEAEQGNDLYLTLDIDIQVMAEAALETKVGSAVALLVETGEVIASVSKPGYDLNEFSPVLTQSTFNRINEEGGWLNRSIQGLYPPGSTFKVVTALAALNTSGFNPNNLIYCGPNYRVGNRLFPENQSYGYGNIALMRALAVSSNVYFYQVALETGIQSIADQARVLGLDEKTGIELPFESDRTLVPDRQWKRDAGRGGWVDGDTANVSIGQGDLLVTPLQMARLTAAIAQKREFLPVTLLRDKNTTLFNPQKLNISDSRFDYIIEGMRQCVIDGTGKSMQIPGIEVAAKTGTAQVFPGGIEENLAWVIAFAPVENPRLAVAVVIENTESSDPIYGGSTAGPIAKSIFEEFFEKYGY